MLDGVWVVVEYISMIKSMDPSYLFVQDYFSTRQSERES